MVNQVVMAEQLDHLMALADLGTVSLQVLPSTTPASSVPFDCSRSVTGSRSCMWSMREVASC